MTAVEFGQQPGLGEAPSALDGALRNVEQFGNLAVLQADEEAEFDDFGLGCVLGGESVQRLVDMEQLSRVMLAGEFNVVEGNSFAAAAVAKLEFAAGIIDENAAHAFGRGTEEMGAVLPGLVRRAHQAQPGLMNKSGGLECVAGGFTCHAMRRQFSELVINQREQFLGGFGITLVNAIENLCDVAYKRTVLEALRMWKRQEMMKCRRAGTRKMRHGDARRQVSSLHGARVLRRR